MASRLKQVASVGLLCPRHSIWPEIAILCGMNGPEDDGVPEIGGLDSGLDTGFNEQAEQPRNDDQEDEEDDQAEDKDEDEDEGGEEDE